MYPLLYRKKILVCICTGILLFAVILRFTQTDTVKLQKNLQKTIQKLPIAEAVLYLEAGIRLSDISVTESVRETEPKQPAQTQAVNTEASEPTQEVLQVMADNELSFMPQEAEEITFRGNCSYTVDKQELLTAPLLWDTPAQGAQVLIVHSHTSESYTPSEGYEYEASGDYRTLDKQHNVVAVGAALKASLEQAGICVLHDTTVHDYPSYNSSYANSRQTIAKLLEDNPSIVMVIDVHRDAAEEVFRETAQVEGETVAKLMLVVGTDEGGLAHPYWRENLSCALKLQALANRRYPGLFKSLALRASRFNQDMTAASMIVEVGSTGNTLPEAIAAADRLGKVVAELLTANQ